MLDRPLLNFVWKERISMVLEIEDRRYSIFIEPDLLTSFSFGPVPNAADKALTRANKKRKLFIQYPYFSLWRLSFFSIYRSFFVQGPSL